jgi:flavin reductase (DIM6/NTAB) family NADH-FMN oxidoreductase RutF
VVSSKTSHMAANPLTALEFRHALGQFATGITVVTAERTPGRVHGMTANSFASVSLDPALILICVDQAAHLLPMVSAQKRFGVSVLKEDQRAMSEYFAQPEENVETEERLGIRFGWTPSGIPVLEDTLVQLGCTVVASYLSGDHTVFIGEVETARVYSGEPLLFFRGQYRQIAPPR